VKNIQYHVSEISKAFFLQTGTLQIIIIIIIIIILILILIIRQKISILVCW